MPETPLRASAHPVDGLRAAWWRTRLRARTAALGVLAAAVGAGCALLAPPYPTSVVAFDILGRVAVRHEGRAFTSNLRWRHGASGGEVWLMTPLGQTLAHIRTNEEGATLTAIDGQEYRAASVEALTGQALGWQMPLSRLTWWIRGEPVPDVEPSATARDERGRLTALAQDGWEIDFVNYSPGEQGGLPRRLDMRSDGQEMRILIDTWRRPEPRG